nr:hypothetical protein [Escherichia coli]
MWCNENAQRSKAGIISRRRLYFQFAG